MAVLRRSLQLCAVRNPLNCTHSFPALAERLFSCLQAMFCVFFIRKCLQQEKEQSSKPPTLPAVVGREILSPIRFYHKFLQIHFTGDVAITKYHFAKRSLVENI